MTRMTNARIAGVAYLLYIGVSLSSMALSSRANAGEGLSQIASMAHHGADVRVAAVLALVGCFCALILAVTLFAITRDQDHDLAMFALTCRVAEGVVGAAGIPATLSLLGLATATGAHAPDPAATQTLAAFVNNQSWFVSATFFAVGSTIFCWLLLRGKMVPVWLAAVGVIGSALVVVGLPLQTLDVLAGSITQLMWLPIAIFEIGVAVWFLIKGVR